MTAPLYFSRPPTARRRNGRHRWRCPSLAATILVGTAVMCIAGCATPLSQWVRNGFKVGPNYERPPAPVSPEWVEQGDSRVKNDPPTDCAWWTVFGDPTLNVLVDTAYRQNLDLRVAGTRILTARAQRNIEAANLFPQSQTAMAAYAHGQISENLNLPLPGAINLFATGFNMSWELDFWGRYRRTVEAANADWAQSVEQYGETLVLILSEVATTYVELRTFEQRLEYVARTSRSKRDRCNWPKTDLSKGWPPNSTCDRPAPALLRPRRRFHRWLPGGVRPATACVS